jgi:hypothetical protein
MEIIWTRRPGKPQPRRTRERTRPLGVSEFWDRDESPWETERRIREQLRELEGLEEEDPHANPELAEMPRRKGGKGR